MVIIMIQKNISLDGLKRIIYQYLHLYANFAKSTCICFDKCNFFFNSNSLYNLLEAPHNIHRFVRVRFEFRLIFIILAHFKRKLLHSIFNACLKCGKTKKFELIVLLPTKSTYGQRIKVFKSFF